MKKSNKIFLALFAIYLVLVAYCCFWNFDSLPAVDSTMFGIPTDKLVHFIMFFPFPILCYLAFEKGWKEPWQILLAVLAVAAMGLGVAAATEVGQSFTGYRSGDPKDFRADALAVGISSLIIFTATLIKTLKSTRR